ncbi:MAG TPA: NADH-quinone oxidoreductase subunit C [Cytophagaceae bacterium]|jgi:NADH-quinone oxidoreductase subunit C|nr:NADH-quinone oxidoreductase subunit C [Cytophagaceae bacterium]
MLFPEIKNKLVEKFGEAIVLSENTAYAQPQLTIAAKELPDVCLFLRDTEGLYFDYLSCLTGLDNGPEKKTMEVLYHLYSIPYEHSFVIKVETDREQPEVPTVSTIWRTADWHEREAYDLFGIRFTNHPDLRRILMPADWEGFPLRKDYQEQEYYHGIKVRY